MTEFSVKYPPLPTLPEPPSLETRNVEAAEESAQATQQATQIAQQSLDIADKSLWVSGGVGVLTTVFAVATTVAAIKALNTWKAQMYGEHQYASAMTALKALRNMRSLIQERRAGLKLSLRPPVEPQIVQGGGSADNLAEQLRARALSAARRMGNIKGQQEHYDFAVQLMQERDRLEDALVGLEPQWGTTFTAHVNAVVERIEEFADASKMKENLQAEGRTNDLRAIQTARTADSEQSDHEHRALLWLGVPIPTSTVEEGSAEAVRLANAGAEIVKPLIKLEDWLQDKLRELTGTKPSRWKRARGST